MKVSLNQGLLQSKLSDIKVEVFDSLPTTQDYLKLKIAESNHPSICLAEQQTAGRGRGANRQWISPYASNIYLSYLWITNLAMPKLEGLSLVVGLSLVTTLKSLGVSTRIKWPNDIICHDKKLAGILIESFKSSNGSKVIIGIGLNVNMKEEKSITQAWTSLKNESGREQDRNQIVISLMQTLQNYLQQFEQKGLESFMGDWQQYDYLYGKTLTVTANGECQTGKACGINHHGHLLMESDNQLKAFSTADIELKK